MAFPATKQLGGASSVDEARGSSRSPARGWEKASFSFFLPFAGNLAPAIALKLVADSVFLRKRRREEEKEGRKRERKNERREDKEKVRVGRNPNLNCFETSSNVIACFVRYGGGGKKGIVFIWIEASSKARLI